MANVIGVEYTHPFRVKDIEVAKRELAFDGVDVHVVKEDGVDKIVLVAEDVSIPYELTREDEPVEGDITSHISAQLADVDAFAVIISASTMGDQSARAGVTVVGVNDCVRSETLEDLEARLVEEVTTKTTATWYLRAMANHTPLEVAQKARQLTTEQFAQWAASIDAKPAVVDPP